MCASQRMKHILLAGLFLTLSAVSVAQIRYGTSRVAGAADDLAFGERVYRENCAACHGEKGDGKGPKPID